MRRSDTINHVAIELAEDRWAAEFRPRLAACSGVWEPGLWKHTGIWRIECAIHFRMPVWAVQGNEVVVSDWWRPALYVEYVEHWVYAKDRSMAIACLVRDLNQDERAEFISHAAVYRVLAPPTKREVLELEQINARLRREWTDLRERQATEGRRPQRQMEFAVS